MGFTKNSRQPPVRPHPADWRPEKRLASAPALRPLPALPHLANCGRAGSHQKKGKKEEKHWNAPQCQGGPAGPAAHGQVRRAGGLKEEHGKRRNAKQGRRAALGRLRQFYFMIIWHTVQKVIYRNKRLNWGPSFEHNGLTIFIQRNYFLIVFAVIDNK